MLSFPINLTLWVGIPSVPPWNGTENFNWSAVGPFTPVVSKVAPNEPENKLELGWPEWFSTLNAPAILFSSIDGNGFRKFLLSYDLSSNCHPKNPLEL